MERIGYDHGRDGTTTIEPGPPRLIRVHSESMDGAIN